MSSQKNNDDMFKIICAIFIFLPSCLLAFIDEPYHETAFIGPSNSFYGLTYFSFYQTNHFWNAQGKKLPSFNKFTRNSYRLLMEYDLNCSNAFFLKGGFTSVDETLNGRSRGLEDPEVSWQSLFYRNESSAFSGKLTAVVPVGPKKSTVRYGQWGGEFQLLYSRIFKYLHRLCWYDLSLGYRGYSGYPSDQVRSHLSLGCRLSSFLWLISTTRLEYGIFNGKENTNRNNICFNPNYRLLNTQIESIVEIYTHILITAGGFFHLWGENVGAGGGFYSGLWMVF